MDNNLNNVNENANLFLYLINIDNYISEYLHILYLKKNKNINNMLFIDSYYINFFKKIIKDSNIKDTCIVTKQNLIYNNLIDNEICSKVNNEYLKNTSISYLYLFYIIQKWDNLPSNVFFFNDCNENTFPIELYIVPKKNIEILSNNHKLFNLVSGKIILSTEENRKVRQKTNLSFIEWWNKYIKKNIPEIFEYCPELVFSVKRENIKKNSKDYYLNIFNYINSNPYCKELYYLDRCWYYIFL